MTKELFLVEEEAKRILVEHTSSYMQGIEIDPAEYTDEEIVEEMYEECSCILTNDLLNGKYTLKQYVAVRNKLGELIFSLLPSEEIKI